MSQYTFTHEFIPQSLAWGLEAASSAGWVYMSEETFKVSGSSDVIQHRPEGPKRPPSSGWDSVGGSVQNFGALQRALVWSGGVLERLFEQLP